MRLRTAIKIMRHVEGSLMKSPRYNYVQVDRARVICQRKWKDGRIPYIPSDEEILEQSGWLFSILGEALIDDPDRLDAFKEELWTEIETEKEKNR